ncbi:MAG: DUF1214 domain-containing protein [Pseudomonadota bacterium]
MTRIFSIWVVLWALFTSVSVSAEQTVTIDTFVRAETDRYFASQATQFGVGKFRHYRNVAPIENQRVIRMNRDTVYSAGVFDLTTPVTILKPDTGQRYQSLHAINQDHYTKLVAHDGGEYTLTQAGIGTRYVFVIIRTLVDLSDPEDLAEVAGLQDKIGIRQENAGAFSVPSWDQTSLTKVRDAAKTLAISIHDNRGVFGDAHEVDPIKHFLGAAYGWGGLPVKHAYYTSQTPNDNDGITPFTLRLNDMPADAFWSISIYNEAGFFEKNPHDAYVISDRNAKQNADGSVTIHFGGDPEQKNFLPITPGWNYTVRLYQPQISVQDGSWQLPKAEPVSK